MKPRVHAADAHKFLEEIHDIFVVEVDPLQYPLSSDLHSRLPPRFPPAAVRPIWRPRREPARANPGLRSGLTGEPSNGLSPESRVSRPCEKRLGAPMRADIRCPSQRASGPDGSHRENGMLANECQDRRLR